MKAGSKAAYGEDWKKKTFYPIGNKPSCILLPGYRLLLIRLKYSLTGSGEVHNPLGEYDLSCQFDCLPALQ